MTNAVSGSLNLDTVDTGGKVATPRMDQSATPSHKPATMANEAGAPGPSCVTPIASAESYPPPAEHACAGCNPYQGSSTTVDDNAANSPAYALSTPAAQVSGGGGRQVDQETDEARAARVIQKHYRRHAARQKADERRLKM